MIQAEATTHILRPVESVFAFVDDFSKAPSWYKDCLALTQTSPGSKGVGTRFHYLSRSWEPEGSDGVVTAYERNIRLRLTYTARGFDTAIEFQFAREAGGTKVIHSLTLIPTSLFSSLLTKLISPLVRAGNRKVAADNLSRLKHEIEQ